jgi:hypothetical protein
MIEMIGTKIVLMTPMTRAQYNEYRGWGLPGDEDGNEEGYLVEYPDSRKRVHPAHAGYISWSPKAEADAAYQNPREGMTFGHAIEFAKRGYRIARRGWNGKGMFLILVPGRGNVRLQEGSPYAAHTESTHTDILPHIDMWTADKKWLPGWLASQSDMLADDWVLVE